MKIKFLFAFLSFGLLLAACNGDDDDAAPVTCDTVGITYTDGASEILNGSCAVAGCHASGSTSTFPMGNFQEAAAAVAFGRIIGAINHDSDFLPMPYPAGTPKLAQCDIDKLTAWINDGAPE